jgi:hypothetical protein
MSIKYNVFPELNKNALKTLEITMRLAFLLMEMEIGNVQKDIIE